MVNRKDGKGTRMSDDLPDELRKLFEVNYEGKELPDLESLLAGDDKTAYYVTDEDRDWIYCPAVGRERIEDD